MSRRSRTATTDAPAPILTVAVASGRLGMARRRGEDSAPHEAALKVAQVAEAMLRTFGPWPSTTPLTRDQREALADLLWTLTEGGTR